MRVGDKLGGGHFVLSSLAEVDLTLGTMKLEAMEDISATLVKQLEEDKATITTEETKLITKLDRRIMPIVCTLYLFACTSPANIRILV